MRTRVISNRSDFFARAGQLISTTTLAIVMTGGCGSVSSTGGDAAAGTSGQSGHAGTGAGGTTGSAGTTGAAGTGDAGSIGAGGSSTGSGGSTAGSGGSSAGSAGSGGSNAGSGGSSGGGGAGRGGNGGTAGATGAGGGAAGRGGAGGNAGSTGSGGNAGGRGGTGGNGGSAGSGGSAGGRGGGGGTASPCQAVVALDRSCTTPADCFAGAHTTDCCGNGRFIGFNNAVKTQFQTLEAACDATYPGCGCPAGPPTTDDGSVLGFNRQPGVTCLQGKCMTFVPDCGQPCATGTTCFSCGSHNQIFAACTTMCADSNACTDPTLPLCQMGSSGNTSGKFCTPANVQCDTR